MHYRNVRTQETVDATDDAALELFVTAYPEVWVQEDPPPAADKPGHVPDDVTAIGGEATGYPGNTDPNAPNGPGGLGEPLTVNGPRTEGPPTVTTEELAEKRAQEAQELEAGLLAPVTPVPSEDTDTDDPSPSKARRSTKTRS